MENIARNSVGDSDAWPSLGHNHSDGSILVRLTRTTYHKQNTAYIASYMRFTHTHNFLTYTHNHRSIYELPILRIAIYIFLYLLTYAYHTVITKVY